MNCYNYSKVLGACITTDAMMLPRAPTDRWLPRSEAQLIVRGLLSLASPSQLASRITRSFIELIVNVHFYLDYMYCNIIAYSYRAAAQLGGFTHIMSINGLES